MSRHKAVPGFALVLLCLLTCAPAVMAQEQVLMPLWEVGAGMATIRIPDYRGSRHYSIWHLPIPYAVYRGENIRADRQGIRGILFESSRVYFDLSVAAGAPVNSDKNTLRQGMPDLDPTLQVGPALKVTLYGREYSKKFINFSIPMRKVIATNFRHYRGEGYLVHPHLNFNYGRVAPRNEWNMGMSAGLIYTDKQYHDYYYTVRQAWATADRPAYHSGSGYSGFRATFTYTRRSRDYWLGTFIVYDNLRNAVIEDSPMVESKHSWIFGIAAAWVFSTADKLVPARD